MSIDHLVHVSEAHQRSTADMWNYQRRERFANDPNNLFVVENSTHRAKRWKPPHQWLPEKNRCRYLYQWIAVKSAYRLSITNQEKASLEKLFPRHC